MHILFFAVDNSKHVKRIIADKNYRVFIFSSDVVLEYKKTIWLKALLLLHPMHFDFLRHAISRVDLQ